MLILGENLRPQYDQIFEISLNNQKFMKNTELLKEVGSKQLRHKSETISSK